MKKKITIDSSLPLLRNGKPHVSYSEVSTWAGCGYRHNLLYIPASDEEIISPYLDYGTIVHDAGESFLNTRKIDIPAVHEKIKEAWKKRGWKYKHVKLPGWLDSATNALTQLPDFMEEAFPGWKTVEAEHMLYTDVIKTTGYFKGYIDCVIELPNGKHVIIDWKTAGAWGWRRDKKQDLGMTVRVNGDSFIRTESHGKGRENGCQHAEKHGIQIYVEEQVLMQVL